MKRISIGLVLTFFATVVGLTHAAHADNQTDTLSPVLSGTEVPFSIQIEQAAFQLPSGLQSFVLGKDRGRWLLIAGRINGLHGFNNSGDFPPNQQNTTVFVVDPRSQTVTTRLLTDSESGLTQAQVDLLSVTSAQSVQTGRMLYIAGGYGVDTSTGEFTTKDALTAINVRGLIHWVTNPSVGETAAQHIRQIFDPVFQVTGGFIADTTPARSLPARHRLLLGFGQNFSSDGVFSDGIYSQQIRRFRIVDRGRNLRLISSKSLPEVADTNYRRTGLNVVPVIENGRQRFVAFSGVFTPTNGVWTVPVEIGRKGLSRMADPADGDTFKQSMNNYLCASLKLYSRSESSSYTVLMGGLSYGFFSAGDFQTDAQLPFINQVTAIKRDQSGIFSQYLMDAEYPEILSTGSNPGNPLLFGTSATFIPERSLPKYDNGVIKLDQLGTDPLVVGYIVGGIQSTLPNTNTQSDTAASPYIFTVTLVRGAANQ